ncbi:hypothetical protein BGZ94_000623 [Podila epigama]|nr:hypothetical protein BGZ94_000623 [Podila epigama]
MTKNLKVVRRAPKTKAGRNAPATRTKSQATEPSTSRCTGPTNPPQPASGANAPQSSQSGLAKCPGCGVIHIDKGTEATAGEPSQRKPFLYVALQDRTTGEVSLLCKELDSLGLESSDSDTDLYSDSDSSDSDDSDEFDEDYAASVLHSVLRDITVSVQGQEDMVLMRQKFLELTGGYHPFTKLNIFWRIETFFEFLDTKSAFGKEQDAKIKGMTAVQTVAYGLEIQEHIAKGRVFICDFELPRQDSEFVMSTEARKQLGEDGSLIKIVYTTNTIKEKVKQLSERCGYENVEVLTSYPENYQEPIGFVHLFNQIVQELYGHRQMDLFCKGCCDVHSDFYVLESVGKCNQVESRQLHLDSVKRDIVKWLDFFQDLHPVYLLVAEMQNRLDYRLKKKCRASAHRRSHK